MGSSAELKTLVAAEPFQAQHYLGLLESLQKEGRQGKGPRK
jgi:DNA-binding SARP family transcriptional activator